MLLNFIADPADPRLDPYRNVRDRDLKGRDGAFMAEGKVVLRELLFSKRFEARSVLVLESRLEGLRPLLDEAPPDLPVYCVSQPVMDTIAGFNMHRGILAMGGPLPFTFDAAPYRENALVLIASGISNHDNVGALFRNAAAFEADSVILDRECCSPLYRKAIRVSVGAALKVPFRHEETLDTILDGLAREGFHIAALSPAGKMPVTCLPKSGKRALLVGSEGHGLAPYILKSLSTWSIPMSSGFDSLNVATASAIALFHSSHFSG